jgi:hypothetical protein
MPYDTISELEDKKENGNECLLIANNTLIKKCLYTIKLIDILTYCDSQTSERF